MYGTVARDHMTALSTRIAGGPAAAHTARELLTRLLADTTPAATLHDAELLTSELVTNAVLHAQVDRESAIEVGIAAGPSLVRVSVADAGSAETEPLVQELDLDVPGGLGLYLVDQISTRWGVEPLARGGTEVWFELEH
jgi:anti-sigma regulatory factor (Ser/Thr protein kinase)